MGLEMVESIIMCMNILCECTNSSEWMDGWALNGGEFAKLCFICGSAYAKSIFCQIFHKDELGWSECRMCGKAIHCGCIASKHMYDHLDIGGICCKTCKEKDIEHHARESLTDGTGRISDTTASRNNGHNIALDKGKMVTSQEPDLRCPQTERIITRSQRHALLSNDGTAFASSSNGPQPTPVATNAYNTAVFRDIINSQRINDISSTRLIIGEENAQTIGQNAFIQSMSNLLHLPRSLAKHLPQVSNMELQQIFAALNTQVTPLFEKVLTVTDVRGRMILPKACASAYFPYLAEQSGVEIPLLDSNGKNWNFELTYWNNNNSRMYVFEGVHGYITEMGLRDKDIVIFGLIYPDKFIIGFKKTPRHPRDLRITRRQAQFLIQPDPKSTRNVFMIEGHEIEEFDRPPIIGNNAESTPPVSGPSSPASARESLNGLDT